uniref:Uncharacterized protein n=1 Tax=Fagus sylvatica TaxID=28930 RepID=A0A2N9G2C5_FAGSY
MATSSSSAVPTAANAAPRLSSAGMVVATSTAVATSSSSAVPTAANAAPRSEPRSLSRRPEANKISDMYLWSGFVFSQEQCYVIRFGFIMIGVQLPKLQN